MMSKKGGRQLCKNIKNVPATPKLCDNSRVYFTTKGAQYMALDVGGVGLCALLGVIAVAMDDVGTPCEEIFEAVSGELTDVMTEYVQSLRANIVSTCGDQFAFKDGEELASFDDIVHDPMWVIATRAMWELVTLHPTGYLDGRAVWLLAKFLGLHGFRIVKHEDGHLVSCDAGGPISSEECPMMLHDGYGHFKALIPLRRMPLEFQINQEYHLLLEESFVDVTDEEEAVPGTSDLETSDGTDEVPESAVAVDVAGTEASDGGSMPSAQSSGSGGGDSDLGARGAFGEDAEGEEVKAATRVSSKRSQPWDDNEYWDDDANYYSGCTIVGEDGWTLVGKEGRRMGLETTLAFDEASGLYDLTSPNKCQPLFLDHDDETDENEAAEVDEAVDEVGEDEAAEEVDEDEEAEAEAGEETQGRPKRDRRPAGGVFAPGWAPDPAPNARNDSARESEEDGEDSEDSGDADDVASLDGVSDGKESEEDEEDSDEDSGKGPRGAGGGAGGVASAGDKNSDLEDSGYAPSEAGDTDGDNDEDTTSDECSSTGGETRCEGCEEDFYCELVECPTCNAKYCQDCENDLSSDKERTYSRCQRADDDGVGDFSTGGVTDGPDEYTDTESGSVSGNSKRRRRSAGKKDNCIPRTSSPRELLMVPKDDQQAKLMLSLYRKAREMERKLAGKTRESRR
ncbi:hypothetical protein Esi_0102_0084 [Ectocarpus siliculosus]|uniref:Uncharacterized protein n=1 Tax=Ectocarpus siliculosus TaxID=2880 RepID=D7FGY2_ECTSI|nr:hypothetical protein Esi_0102_0084 [Ectocarpus siliculosus]|eukprot:CBJ48971.1 hypothetical protein Esi_0102_0084 [Ectocarpus siliculosus]